MVDMVFPVLRYLFVLLNVERNVTTSPEKKKKNYGCLYKTPSSHTSTLLKQTLNVIF